MSTNRNDILIQILGLLDGAGRLYSDAQRARAMDAQLARAKNAFFRPEDVASLFGKIASAPVWETLKYAIQDAVTVMLEEDSFSPCEAAKPAHHLLQALDNILRGGVELKHWANDERFKPHKRQRRCLLDWLRMRPDPQPLVPAAEIVEQMAYVVGLLGMATREVHLVSETILGVRDLRAHLVPKSTEPTKHTAHSLPKLPHVEVRGYLISLPTRPYQSEREKVRDLRLYVMQLGEFLIRVAELGQERIRCASLDNKAFSPGVVAAEAIAITGIVTNGITTCAALATLACQQTGDSVTIESGR